MRLRELLVAAHVPCSSESPALEDEVTQLSTNSWDCRSGTLFIGMPGTRVDGGNFWPSAVAAGAIAAVVSPQAKLPDPNNPALVIPVDQIEQACGQLATAFYNYPAQKLSLVGVTGTNGKTTTTHLIEYLVNEAHQAPALFGTLYSRWPGHEVIATHTTPFAVTLQGQLAAAVQAGAKVGIMEVSSHSLAQGRTWGCEFTAAVFTNLTQDHLDYHKDLEDYFAAKALLFEENYLKGRAIINGDDPYGQRLLSQFGPDQAWSYRTKGEADLWATDLQYRADGVSGIIHTPKGTGAFNSPLVGQFNVENLLAAIGVGLHLGLDLTAMLASLPQFPGVPGRMQQVKVSPAQDISVIVDYAHTPDSLENLLKAARPFIPGQMICVFGCGGDRDRSKRPQMGKIAADLADHVVVTSDNPRTEDPQGILEDILAGIEPTINPLVEADRHQAILDAILQAQPGDGVVIAGKGHEDYQILGTEKVHFDDREEATAALKQRLDLE
ncbi:UDP-N-acetylmuramoyl-L-alanyl-D-glutamate--2,6-diaminopimelate ligase [Thermosynechococcaceae cyanobacterium BACA0444]|uniref:UDP-N-acetylmuramoyl-L-alanyl-D-glutamate--2,6-diaminopimelate ligase n=1 Tax=Pseudocalidococcus azoricus BACA0444 TaxID=2918990 RepID=A0AAE4FRL6_9CYAN|nr:UDP-N-acetylmuramoyl-L-alanyl-D-glutamate--2,6-diaminopimelate ligase [Pseudocalidococcus azoricus]MDS3859997.1 UDP-N-acetylmuramoyl-L-alanyl-D-glutamate--2,6-diaminopimelate ligase [Pseudocalidococcus azoricus BACA0444]